eukprot:28703-Chlamydomonas_euryale.AAC.1
MEKAATPYASRSVTDSMRCAARAAWHMCMHACAASAPWRMHVWPQPHGACMCGLRPMAHACVA